MQGYGCLGNGNRCLAHRNKETSLDGMVLLFLHEKYNSCPCWVCYILHSQYAELIVQERKKKRKGRVLDGILQTVVYMSNN